MQFFVEVKKELDVEIESLNTLMEDYVSKINDKVTENKIKMISLE